MDEEIIILEEEVETIEEIEVEEIVDYNIVDGGTRHSTLLDRNTADQHEIGAITGLKEKLDNIESLKPIRSNLSGYADYYLWGEEGTDTNPLGPGYFVRLGEDGMIHKCANETVVLRPKDLPLDTNEESGEVIIYALAGNITTADINKYYVVGTQAPYDIYAYDGIEYVQKSAYSYDGKQVIKTCHTTDILGVTVSSAGFIGNDENVTNTYVSAKATDINYALVATAGVVDVLCKHDVIVGDYVFPTVSGWAAKSTGSYGYLVTALVQNGVIVQEVDEQEMLYARIVLSQSMVNAKKVSDNIDYLLGETKKLNENIVTFGNTSEVALKRVEELSEIASSTANDANNKAQNAIDAAVVVQNAVDILTTQSNSASQDATEAKKAADEAVKEASRIKQEAIDAAYEAAAQGDIEFIQALEYRLDECTVGQYSQAYGLTYEQAKKILPIGTTFIPMDEDPTAIGAKQEFPEVYADKETVVEQIFTVGHAYKWNGTKWSADKPVLITRTPSNQDTGYYWFVVKEYDGTDYECGSLYRWESGAWNKVACRKENVMSRTMSHLYKDNDTIRNSVSTLNKTVATIESTVTESDARVGLVTSVPIELSKVKPANDNGTIPKGEDDDATLKKLKDDWTDHATSKGNGTYYYVLGTQPPYDVYACVVDNGTAKFAKLETITYDGVNFYKVNTASIITAVNNEGESGIQLNASKINFVSEEFKIYPSEDGQITSETPNFSVDKTGNVVVRGDIYANDGEFNGVIHAKEGGTIGGYTIGETDLTSGNVGMSSDQTDGAYAFWAGELSKTQNDDGTTTDGGNSTRPFWVKNDGSLHAISADIEGHIKATSGEIGGCGIIDGQLTARYLSSISANLGDITAGVIRSEDYTSKDEIYIWPKASEEEATAQADAETSEGENLINASAHLVFRYDTLTNSYYVASFDTTSIVDLNVKVVVPSAYNDGINGTASVIGIDWNAFENCDCLTSVEIPDSVIEIGFAAFKGCTNLTNITLPFTGETREATSPKAHFGYIFGAGSYEDSAAYIPISLKTVIINSNILSINTCAFYQCCYLTNITIPNGITSIGDSAFYNCTSLTNITIPDGVINIGDGAFSHCESLADIIIPNSVINMGYGMFTHCTNLTSIIMPSNITSISSNMFYNCTSLRNLVIPNGVKSISHAAFYLCTSLINIKIPNSVEEIGLSAFNSCSSLMSIEIPDSVTKIDTLAFADCTSLIICCEAKSQPSGWNSNWNSSGCPVAWEYEFTTDEQGVKYALSNDKNAYAIEKIKPIQEAVIEDTIEYNNENYNITTIGGAFKNYLGLISLTIGSNVTRIVETAFLGCEKLIEIYNKSSLVVTIGSEENGHVAYYAKNVYTPTSGVNRVYSNGNAILYSETESEDTKTILVGYNHNAPLEDYLALPENISEISDYAFYDNTNVEKIVFLSNTKVCENSFVVNEGSLAEVYYQGTKDEWESVTNGVDVSAINNIYYYSEEEPEPNETDKFWCWDYQKGFLISSNVDDEYLINSRYFKVNKEGRLTATNASFNGEVQAMNGIIGGYGITDNTLYALDGSVTFQNKQIVLGNPNTDNKCEIYYNETDNQTVILTSLGDTKIMCGKTGSCIELSNDEPGFADYIFTLQAQRYTANGYDWCYRYRVKTNKKRTMDTQVAVCFKAQFFKTNSSVRHTETRTYTFTIPSGEDFSGWYFTGVLNDASGNDSTLLNFYFVNNQSAVSQTYSLGSGQQFPYNIIVDLAPTYTQQFIDETLERTGKAIKFNADLLPFESSIDAETKENNSDDAAGAQIIGQAQGGYNLGSEGATWKNLYLSGTAYNSTGGSVNISDLNLKNTINLLSDTYSQLFDNLKPVTYKYNAGTSDRLHAGFIAQDVKSAMDTAGLTTKDFAGYCEWEGVDGDTTCGLRYSEFIALCVDQIQKLKARVEELANKLETQQNDCSLSNE